MASKEDIMTVLQPLIDSRDWPLMSDLETLTHLLKAALSTGLLVMPMGFKDAGLLFGVVGSVVATAICAHCPYMLVKVAHELYIRTKVNALTFQDIGEVAFTSGPGWAKKFGHYCRYIILMVLFAAYFGICSVYTVIVATNLQQVVEHYTNTTADERWYIAGLLPPLILLGWVPNLKWLVPISMIANVLMGIGLVIIIYYLVQDLPPISERLRFGDPFGWPNFFCIVIFSTSAIGMIMPLENNMKAPRNFIATFGILNVGMTALCLVYTTIGFLGYLKYGEATEGSITLNFPVEEAAAQSVKFLIALGVFCTYGLQLIVPVQMLLNVVKHNFPHRPILVPYIVRTLFVTATVVLAIVVPTIGPFVSLIGALCMALLGIMVPAVLETVTFWESGLGRFKWRLWKNVCVFAFGMMSMVFGTITSLKDIAEVYIK